MKSESEECEREPQEDSKEKKYFVANQKVCFFFQLRVKKGS